MSDAPLMLGVSGLRGLVGRSLTPDVASRYAAAFGQWLRQRSRARTPLVVLGRDSRPSGEMLELAVTAGLIAVGCRVVRLGIVATPTTAIMVEHLRAHGGMVITASHNPLPWNGIKALGSDGAAPPADEAAELVDQFRNGQVTYTDVTDFEPTTSDAGANEVHLARVLAGLDVSAIQKRGLKIVLDSVHGAGGPGAAMLLDRLGVHCTAIAAEPDGRFQHPPEPTRENLKGLCAAVREHKADLGLAQDPDADRLALVDEHGTYIGEEYTLALAARHVLETASSRKAGDMLTVAANLSTSRMIDDVAAKQGATVIRTPVGEANVAAAMRRGGALIGGEGNGGVIWPRVAYVRDSLGGMGLILDMLARNKATMSGLVTQMPAYAIVKDKLPVDADVVARLPQRLPQALTGCRVDLQDGVRMDWDDCWVHVRPSNTEPILRIIAEAPDQNRAEQLVRRVREAIA